MVRDVILGRRMVKVEYFLQRCWMHVSDQGLASIVVLVGLPTCRSRSVCCGAMVAPN